MSTIDVRSTIAERGKRDLFFLAKEILGYRDMEEDVHGPVCRFFVQKDPSLPFGYQSRRKNRALFDPRSHYKTSITIADTIQWVLCFPDITYLKMSGSQPLTQRIIMEIKQHFEANTIFREIYPEYCPDEEHRWGMATQFTVPNRTRFRREPTVAMATVDSVKASAHYDIRDGDDIVNEENSRSKDSLQQTTIDWKHTRPLVNPGGYTQFTDTRYDFSDCGGDIIESNPPIGPVDDLNGFGFCYEGKDWNIFCRSCWKNDENGKRVLLFPQKFRSDDEDDPNKENLDAIQREDPYLFSCQYLNNPAPQGTQSFSRELLLNQTVLRANIPSNVVLYMTQYLPADSNEMEPQVGIVGGFSPDGSLYIVDCFRPNTGTWSSDKIIDSILTAHKKWYVRRIGLDDKQGPILLSPGLESKMREHRLYLPVEYLPVKQAEELRMKSVEALVPLLAGGKMFFSADLPFYDQMLIEFTRFGKFKYAGIPYAVAMLAQHFRSSFQRMVNQSSPVADANVAAQHYGMFDDMATNVDDSQELSAGLVG